MSSDKKTRAEISLLVALLSLLDLPSVALAADKTQTHTSPVAGLGIAFIVCYMLRRKPIGGWLLYYYIQVYLGLVFTLGFAALSLSNYKPSLWQSSGLYFFWVVTTLISDLLLIAQVVVATILLKSRDWKWVKKLRVVLIASLCWMAVVISIDAAYYPSDVPLDIYSLIVLTIWLPYFFRSNRVRRVFLSKDWGAETSVAFAEEVGLFQTPPDSESAIPIESPASQPAPVVSDSTAQVEQMPDSIQAKLRTLENLLGQSLISREEYEAKRRKILNRF